MKKAEIKELIKDFLIHNPQLYTNEENLKWCWLRAVEWGEWPLFLSQLIVPILLLFFAWWKIVAIVVVITWIWVLIRYKYVSIILSGSGPFVIILKWPISIGVGIYFLVKGIYLLAAISAFWPVITLFLLWLTPSTKIGVIKTALMNKLGYEKLI